MFEWLRKEKPNTLWLWTALALFIVMLIINGIAGSTTILGGVQTGEVSDIYANLFAPTGFTFSIWGVIYLLLAGFMLRAFTILKPQKPVLKNQELNQLLVLFSLTSILNASWLLLWQYQLLTLSVVVMVGLLITLIKAVVLLHKQKMSLSEYALVRVPFSVYLGWISVATIANITAWLVSLNWDGFGIPDATWTVIVLIIGAIIAVVMGIMKRDPLYMAVFVWAYFGILYKHMSETGFNAEHGEVIVALAILLPVLVTTIIQLLREHEQIAALMKLLQQSNRA